MYDDVLSNSGFSANISYLKLMLQFYASNRRSVFYCVVVNTSTMQRMGTVNVVVESVVRNEAIYYLCGYADLYYLHHHYFFYRKLAMFQQLFDHQQLERFARRFERLQ